MAEKPAADQGDTKKTGRGWLALAINTYKEMNEDNVGLIAAGVAFYGLLALFPALVAAMAIAGLVMDPAFIVEQLQGLSAFLPREAAQIVIDQAIAIAGSRETGLGLAAVFGLLTAIYSSSKAIQAMIQGLNVCFEVRETRGFVTLYAITFALTLGVILGFLLIVAALALVPALLAVFPLGPTLDWVVSLARWPVVAAIVILGLAIMYRYAPARGPIPWKWVSLGAFIATGLWLVSSVAFSFYAANFGAYNESFGALGGVIALLTWLWLSAYIILMGAEIDAEVARQDVEEPGEPAPVATAKALAPGG